MTRAAPALLLLFAACASGGPPGSGTPARDAAPADTLPPGRTRPYVAHDWPHPRALDFPATSFRPPDAGGAAFVAPGGVRAFILPDPSDPVVQVTAVVPIGRLGERAGEAGAGDVVARLLAQEVAARLGTGVTARVETEQEPDLTRVTVQVRPEDGPHALAALVRALRATPERAATSDGGRTGQGYANPIRGLGGAAFRPAVELARRLATHPVAPPEPGRPIPAAAVRAIAMRGLLPGRVAIGVAGAIDRAAAEASLRELTSGWTASSPPASMPAAPATPSHANGERLVTMDGPGLTTWLALGHVVPEIAPADRAAMAVLGEILNIRLNIATRELRGLTNRALLEYPAPGHGAGLLHVRSGGRPESVAPLLVYALDELSRIREPAGAPSADELAQARGGLALGSWQASLDGARRAAATYATEAVRWGTLDRLLGWPAAVQTVTAADVQRVARQVIDPARLCAVVIGRIDEVERARHPRWPFTLDDVRARLHTAR